jgi:methylisocitrate lyase
MRDMKTAEAFRALHTKGAPLVLFNVWDAGSAKAVEKAGAKALATGSWSIAASRGKADGEKIAREDHLDVIRRIAQSSDLPLTADLESGFSVDAGGVGETIRLAIDAGAIGCNLEDSYPADGSLRDIEEAAARIRAARRAADAILPGFFINARTDALFRSRPEEIDDAMIDEALARADAYAKAGADGLFAPGASELSQIRRLVESSPLPVNIMRLSNAPSLAELAGVGVARISHGPRPYFLAMEALEKAARDVS